MEAYKTSILEYDGIKTAIKLEKLESLEEGIEIGIKRVSRIDKTTPSRRNVNRNLCQSISILIPNK
jgi:hypothetical protein